MSANNPEKQEIFVLIDLWDKDKEEYQKQDTPEFRVFLRKAQKKIDRLQSELAEERKERDSAYQRGRDSKEKEWNAAMKEPGK